MSITPVPISIRLVRAPTAASSGKGEASCWAKWCTRKYAPSTPSSSAATARSMDCSSTSEAERVADCGESVQWPKERNPIFFMSTPTFVEAAGFPQVLLDHDLDPLELLDDGVARRRHRPAQGTDEVHGAVGDVGGAEEDLLERADGVEADPLAARQLAVVGLGAPVEAAARGVGGP